MIRMSAPIAGVLSNLDRVLMHPEAIQHRVADMAREIERDYAGRELFVLALMDGAIFFVADLLRRINLPVKLHTLSVSSYHGATSSSGRVQMVQGLPAELQGQHVLLIDDILDTGLTLGTVHDRVLEECKPQSLRVAVLLSKDRARVREAPAHYVGFEIADEFVVGYGMDYNGPLSQSALHRNPEPGAHWIMKVRVLFFSVLRDVTNTDETVIESSPKATVADLLDQVFTQWPGLRAWDANLLLALDQTYVKRDCGAARKCGSGHHAAGAGRIEI